MWEHWALGSIKRTKQWGTKRPALSKSASTNMPTESAFSQIVSRRIQVFKCVRSRQVGGTQDIISNALHAASHNQHNSSVPRKVNMLASDCFSLRTFWSDMIRSGIAGGAENKDFMPENIFWFCEVRGAVFVIAQSHFCSHRFINIVHTPTKTACHMMCA